MARPALNAALRAVESGEAAGIIVAKLDRLSRSLLDFAALMQRAQHGGWNIVALDLGVDLSTPAGEFLASVMASAAQWERRIISQRTRDALQAKRQSGTRLGRRSGIGAAVLERIVHEREGGASFVAIADALNLDGIPTARGSAMWSPSAVRKAHLSQDAGQYRRTGAPGIAAEASQA
jgi:DNA invertase Pin-like site-specific DNA recombinase